MRVSPGIPLHWLRIVAASATDDRCIDWPWNVSKGYGKVVVGGRSTRCNRLVCELVHGPPPLGYEAAHTCGRPICVNPRHVRWATHRENVGDKHHHGTAQRGEQHPRARLSMLEVTMIRDRRMAGEPLASIARDFFISETHVSRISKGKAWS